MKTQTSFKGVILLLLTALIWGTSFVAQSEGMESVDAFTFQGIRTLLGSLVLVPVILVKSRVERKNLSDEEKSARNRQNKKTWIYGSILGVALCAAANFQQFAFYHSTAGKIAFITAMYMFFVPIVGLFFKKRIPILTWICIALGFVGLYFLSITNEGFGAINRGDVQAFICAIFFTIQILLIEKFGPECDGVKLSCVQFFVSGAISTILMFIFETPQIETIKAAALPILYSGIMSCGIAYTLQIIGQKYCEATIASLLMCMESVFAAISAAIIINEQLTGREVLGCVIMFAAILITQIADIIKARKK
ncbi:MAG: DMT family transporter [Treponema sp.]|nr:DMT family transporter [Candidatus Treponema equifaecale]